MTQQHRFKGQVALVTGAASGIGYAIAERLLREEAAVALVDRDKAKLEEAKETLSTLSNRLTPYAVDITNNDQVQTMYADLIAQYGRLDILVHSAGIAGPTGVNIESYDLESFRTVVDVNLTGSFIMMQGAIEQMIKADYGRVLILASIAGKEGNPGMAGYSASKAGVIGLVKGIGKEYATTGITVNGLAPAVIATPMNLQTAPEQLEYMTSKIPMQRLGTVEEVAAIATWIVSEEASFNTGFIFDLSGGRATY